MLSVVGSAGTACAQVMPPPLDFSQIDQEQYEFIGQVKNSPPAGPGLPATSVQYGYLSHVNGLSDDAIYAPGVPQNEASALLTFYNDSVTEQVTNHGSLKIVIREGTMTVYYNPVPSGDLTTLGASLSSRRTLPDSSRAQ